MIIYSGTKQTFVDAVINDTIAKEIEELMREKFGTRSGTSQFRAWENSLQYMEKVLNDNSIPDNSGVAIEYNVPQTAKRVDFIISGFDEHNLPHVVIVELKQWDELTAVENVNAIVKTVETFLGGGIREVVHPSYQAWSYAMLIQDYNATVQDEKIDIHPCAYLHNYRRITKNDPLDNPIYKEYLDSAPAYAKGDAVKLREFISRYVKKGDNIDLIYKIDNGKIRPSKSLQDAIAAMMEGNQEFYLIDDQKYAFEQIKKTAIQCQKDGKKRTVIVEGGPGTGKSVIAINLLAELTKLGIAAHYVSKNAAPRNVYSVKLRGIYTQHFIDNLFLSSGTFTEAEEGVFPCLICDEAHRLNEKSGLFSNKGENQIKEIIHAAKCSIFFIDESQRVTMKDIGSIEQIENWAKIENSTTSHLTLSSQFRCNGSDGYLAWVDNVLQIRETANTDIGELDFDFRVFDDPKSLYQAIRKKNKETGNARLVAGYCWDWIREGVNNYSVYDISIGDFRISWNLRNDVFALADNSIDTAGCIHTVQGLEFDYVGVIIGEDMRFENGIVITDVDKRAKTDQSVKGIKKLFEQDSVLGKKRAEEIIKNTYRTLMTRGMKGCYIYCCDAALQAYFKSMMPKVTEKEYVISAPQPVVIDEPKHIGLNLPYERPENEDGIVWLPVIGEIAAGYGVIMDEDVEGYWKASTHTQVDLKEYKKYFFLKVSGQSMINAGIDDGDLVLIRRTGITVKDGDIVACAVHSDSATLKYFHKTRDEVILEPANPEFEPIVIPITDFMDGEAQIIGVLKGIVKPEETWE